jgi:hypothetical protein
MCMSENLQSEQPQEKKAQQNLLISLIRGVMGVVKRAGQGDAEAHQILDDWYVESQQEEEADKD